MIFNKVRMQKIFGIGWAKTGTKTLGDCFKILGWKHQSLNLSLVEDVGRGDLTRILDLAAKKETFEDWPWIILFKELDKAFPGNKFVLTIRDPESWLRSYRNMLQKEGVATLKMNKIRCILYGLPFPDVTDAQLIERYLKHNDDVIQYFSSCPERLLIVNWEKGHGWKELCNFLDVDVPQVEFPHANRGKYA